MRLLLSHMTAEGKQWELFYISSTFSAISVSFVLVFNLAFPAPHQWTINRSALHIVSQVKYLGLLFHSEAALSPSLVNLEQKMYGAWAL